MRVIGIVAISKDYLEIQPTVVAIDEGSPGSTTMIGVAGISRTETKNNIDRQQSAHQPLPQQDAKRLCRVQKLIEQSIAIRCFEVDTFLNIGRAALLTREVDIPAIERWLGAIIPPLVAHPSSRSSNE